MSRVPGREGAEPLRAVTDVGGRSSAWPSASWWRSHPASAAHVAAGRGEPGGELPAVGGGLGRARGGVRADRESRVTDQAHLAERHPRHLDVEHACTNGSATRATTSAMTGASSSCASRRMASTNSALAAPGGSDTARARPSRSVMSWSNSGPAATLRYQTTFISRSPGRTRPRCAGDRVHEDVAVGQHLVGDRVGQLLACPRSSVCLGDDAPPRHVARVGGRPRAAGSPAPSSRFRPRTPARSTLRPLAGPERPTRTRVRRLANEVTSWPSR